MKRSELLAVIGTLSVAVILTGVFWPKSHPAPKSREQEFQERLNAELPQELKTLSKISTIVLEEPDSFRLYSLNPSTIGSEKTGIEYFHEYEVFGYLDITNKHHQTALFTALYKGLAEAKGQSPACFSPRHGIAASKGTNKIELLICFECGKGYEFNAEPQSRYFRVGHSPASTFNAPLKQANIPVAADF